MKTMKGAGELPLMASRACTVVRSRGVASDVAIVRDEDGREIVVKQALPKLKVAADWRCDPARSSQEVEALRVAPALLGSGVVPQVFCGSMPPIIDSPWSGSTTACATGRRS